MCSSCHVVFWPSIYISLRIIIEDTINTMRKWSHISLYFEHVISYLKNKNKKILQFPFYVIKFQFIPEPIQSRSGIYGFTCIYYGVEKYKVNRTRGVLKYKSKL